MEPYLSIVLYARNRSDNDEKEQFQICYQELVESLSALDVPIEIIIVQWNPPMAPRLNMVLKKPKDWGQKLRVRFIDVPESYHRRLGQPDHVQEHPLHALNVGIRRARAPFVLTGNLKTRFSPAFYTFLARQELREDTVYRAVYAEALVNDLPQSLSEALESGYGQKLLITHSEDFLLMPKKVWDGLRGFPELPELSPYTAGLALYAAASQGLKQCVLPWPMLSLRDVLEVDRSGLDYETGFLPWCLQLQEYGRPQINGVHWGLSQEKLEEIEEDALPFGFR